LEPRRAKHRPRSDIEVDAIEDELLAVGLRSPRTRIAGSVWTALIVEPQEILRG